MENYIVSARKYRPTTFDSVVGQVSITSTLKNAIKNNHLAQAFLFCGPRGVGKTTCARILAKTINCFSIKETIEACNECDSCKSFDEGRSLNIQELDGASNNSVEDIRNLIDQVSFAPQLGTHKIYILDEVHMLSSSAFNAFLKTLEEPPKHAIFILATTEKHKIIPTILSRCQIFDFNRIQVNDISSLLLKIAGKENISAEAHGLHIIAQKADGALRDALSMFDQIVSFSGGTISYQDVIDNLNILDYDYYFKVTEAILKNDISTSLLIFNEILNNGFDGHNFINGLAEHLRNLLVCQDEKTVELLEVGSMIKEKYILQSKSFNTNQIISFLGLINRGDTQYKASKNQRLLVEVLLMQLCSKENVPTEKKSPIINLPIGKQPVNNREDSISNTEIEQSKNPSLDASIEKTVSNYSIPKVEIQQVKEEKNTLLNPVVNDEKSALTSGSTIREELVKEIAPIIKDPRESVIITATSTTQKTNVSLKNDDNYIFSDAISINVQPNTQEELKEVEKTSSNRPIETYSSEKITEVLNDYKVTLQEKGKSSLASILEVIPEMNEDIIHLLIENKALEDEFNAQKSDFLDFVRKRLLNYNIQVVTEVNKNVKLKKAYTPQEKFAKMTEKNPVLKQLIKELDMDIGYA